MLETKEEKTEPLVQNHSSPRRRFRRGLVTMFGLGLLILLLSAWRFKTTGQLPFLHRENVWSIAIYEGSSPLELSPITPANTPVLTAADVDDVPALFVADPFMVHFQNEWLMFVEVLNTDTRQGDIGLARSDDGLHWKYDRIVLDETFHLSYPAVFQINGNWLMLPQTNVGVHFYEAESFPTTWRRSHTVLEGTDLADPTLFQHDGRWWMFVARSGTHDQLRLYFANDPLGTWTEHPQSPIVESNADIARPGGPVVKYGEHLYRLGQDCLPKYGNQLRGFRITKLGTEQYSEEPVESGTILSAGRHAWNTSGMHHCDAHAMEDGRWRAAVDGHKKTWILQARP